MSRIQALHPRPTPPPIKVRAPASPGREVHFRGRAQPNAVSAGTFVYSGLLLYTEGLGLLLRKRWAEYLTIITTAALISIEVHEMSGLVTAAKVAVLIINVAIVVYLVRRLRKS